MMLKYVMAVSALLVATSVAAQSPNEVLMGGVGGNVTALDVEAAVQAYPLNSRRSMLSRVEQVQRIAEDTYVRRVLAQEAVATGLEQDPLVQAMVRQAKDRILSDARLYDVGKAGWPADAALQKYAQEQYAAQPASFKVGERVRAKHILVAPKATTEEGQAQALQQTQDILGRIKAGASFEELAKTISADQATAARGGDLGLFELGSMVPEFEAALKGLKQPGELSEVVKTQFGYHIIRFEERLPAGTRTFDEVKDGLMRQARDKAHREAQNAAIAQIQTGAKGNTEAAEAMAKRYANP